MMDAYAFSVEAHSHVVYRRLPIAYLRAAGVEELRDDSWMDVGHRVSRARAGEKYLEIFLSGRVDPLKVVRRRDGEGLNCGYSGRRSGSRSG